ncbi:hypothetical protein MACK_001249 [Theileria orientalis]|uniref:Uncharacterized protein n=1 Tax=Theileria orientalis TaxID=68886 RepID=A0A976MCH4_THEOR|nr:hypothetical protein MACK_001249 [Theileria orientalis]
MSRSERESSSLDSKILGKLNDSVSFLNTVNLYEHNGEGNHTYKVHAYNDQDVKINVKSENVLSSTIGSSFSCYKKLTHTPSGINGKNNKGYRLGNIEYRNNGLTFRLDYTKGVHKWDPLIRVSVYYYNHDIKYEDPLLVELEFENSTKQPSRTSIEYYKLTCNDSRIITWKQDQQAYNAVKLNGKYLINHLDAIRNCLKKVLKVELDKRDHYMLMLSQSVGKPGEFQKANGYQIAVERFESCLKIHNVEYMTFVHKISDIQNFDYNLIGGIDFTLLGANGKPVEISLNDSEGSKTIRTLNYDKCMGDVYVYFSKQSDTHDSVPLFIHFHDQWYTPSSIENYFKTWTSVDESRVFSKLKELGGHRKIEECINKVKLPNQVNGLGVYSIELAKPGSGEDNEISLYSLEMPYVNGRKMSPVSDFQIFSVPKEIHFVDNLENSYVDIETPHFYNSEIPSDIYKKKPYVDLEVPFLHLKPPYVENLENSLLDGSEKASGNVFEPKSLEVGFQDLEDPSSIQGYQLEKAGIFKVLNLTQDIGTGVEVNKVSEEVLDTQKLSKDGLPTAPLSITMASTGQGSQSDDSNQSYLGSILGGTFGKLKSGI